MRFSNDKNLGRAFTLVELLVVISVIGLLMGILVPALGKARITANRTYCKANLRQIGVAFRAYLDDSRDIFPICSEDPRDFKDPNSPIYIPPITKVLGPLLKEPKVFWCKADKQNFKECGTSYRYSGIRLGGRTIKELMAIQMGEKERNIAVMFDLDAYHGQATKPGAKNYLYADWHVSDLTNQD
jgi:prepilin-type N-terminal cleavage/methylation domain-containing protein/prepilin-type processing-associated H-X9-DG protein